MKVTTLLMMTAVVVLSGCSMLPYESKSSCNMEKQYGKCIDVEGAYEEAVTGEDSGAPKLHKVSEGAPKEAVTTSKQAGVSAESQTPLGANEYRNYQDSRYQTLSEIINEPRAPMLSPPRTVRTLIISYTPNQEKKRLYMPRYVYSIIEESEFVLGQYLYKNDGGMNLFEVE